MDMPRILGQNTEFAKTLRGGGNLGGKGWGCSAYLECGA